MPSSKPRFVCPLQIKQLPDGSLAFHVTRRDGTVEVIAGPPGVTRITSNIEAFQPEDSDEVELLFAGGGP